MTLPVGQVLCGDAIEILRTFPDNSMDMVFTDPPYGHNNNNNGDLISRWEAALGRGDYNAERDNRPIANDGVEANDLFRAILPELLRVLKPGSCCCCCGGGGGGPGLEIAALLIYFCRHNKISEVFYGGDGNLSLYSEERAKALFDHWIANGEIPYRCRPFLYPPHQQPPDCEWCAMPMRELSSTTWLCEGCQQQVKTNRP